MSDFLTNLAAKTLDLEPAIRPRLPSLYEPLGFETIVSDSPPRWETAEPYDLPGEILRDDLPPIPHSIRRPAQRVTRPVSPAQFALESPQEFEDDSPQISELTETQHAARVPIRHPTRRSPRTELPALTTRDAGLEPVNELPQISEFAEDKPVLAAPARPQTKRSVKTVMPAPPSAEADTAPVQEPDLTSASHPDRPVVSTSTRRVATRPVVERKVAPENPPPEITTESKAHKSIRSSLVAERNAAPSIPTVKVHPVRQPRPDQPESTTSLIDDTAGDIPRKPVGERRTARLDPSVGHDMIEEDLLLKAARPFALPEPKSDLVNRSVAVERRHLQGQSKTPVIPAPETSPARSVPAAAPVVIAQPNSITPARPARPTRETTTAPQESSTNEPTIQVTIGRIEIRASTNAESRRSVTQSASANLMSLDDYLRQRAQGDGR